MSTLWLLSIGHDGILHWRGYQADGGLSAGSLESTSSTPEINDNDQVVVALPGQQVRSLSKVLPTVPNKTRQQTFAYAVEEELASSLDETHLQVGPQHKDGTIHALAINKARWTQWKAAIEAIDMPHATWLLPNYLYLPLTENHWTFAAGEDDQIMIRTSLMGGMSVDLNQLSMLLPLLLESNETPIDGFIIYTDEAQKARIECVFSQTHLTPTWQMTPPPIDLDNCQQIQSLNLMPAKKWQFDYNKLKLSSSKTWKKANPWRWTQILGVAWVVILIGGSLLEIHVIHNALTRGKQRLQTLFSTISPNTPQPPDVLGYLLHMRQSLSNNLKGDSITRLVTLFAQAKSQTPSIHVLSFSANPQQVVMQVSAPNTTAIDQLMSALKAKQVMAKQTQLTVHPKNITATITLTQIFHKTS